MRQNKNEEQNGVFWISYADLMAGLLFVFLLLVGAVLIKYIYIQNNLDAKTDALNKNKNTLSQKSLALIKAEENIKAIRLLLSSQEAKNANLSTQLTSTKEELHEKNILISKIKSDLFKEQNSSLNYIKQIRNLENNLSLNNSELLRINELLMQERATHQRLVEDLNITKGKIYNLTGIRIKAIKLLKKRLGKSIKVDSQNGTIVFSSSVLFDKGSAKLKEKAKKALKANILKYIQALLGDEEIRQYIDNINIQGFSDSDGDYLYNLQLSEQRAYSVFEFLYKQKDLDKKLLRKYISVSGRSFNSLILKNGKEDKEASRRIELSFIISNKKALGEIERLLTHEFR